MEIKCFRHSVCTQNFAFLEKDKFTFSVLLRILQGECALTLVKGERLVICHSAVPYPVWIWLPDDASEEELEEAYALTKQHLGIAGYRFNLKYPLAKHFIERARQEGVALKVTTNMLAYACEEAVAPKQAVDGMLQKAEERDLFCVTDFVRGFFMDAGLLADIASESAYEEKAKRHISQGFYFWSKGGERVACAALNEMADQCSIGAVFTKREHRRQGYASHLVYALAKQILDSGKLPTLYTNADYSASNACYMKIGFTPRGGLCTIGEST